MHGTVKATARNLVSYRFTVTISKIFLFSLLSVLPFHPATAEVGTNVIQERGSCIRSLSPKEVNLSASEILTQLAGDDLAKREIAEAELYFSLIPSVFTGVVREMKLSKYLVDQLRVTVITDSYLAILKSIRTNFVSQERPEAPLYYIIKAVENRIIDRLRTSEFKVIRKSRTGTDSKRGQYKVDFDSSILTRELLSRKVLSERDRDLIILSWFNDLTFKEIGTELEIQEDTAKKATGRAIEKIQKSLGRKIK